MLQADLIEERAFGASEVNICTVETVDEVAINGEILGKRVEVIGQIDFIFRGDSREMRIKSWSLINLLSGHLKI